MLKEIAQVTAIRTGFFVLLVVWIGGCATSPGEDAVKTITVVGINDIHGQFSAGESTGGLVDISAYVNALRKARAADGGAVLVVDAGDMWQGTLESNIVEGASMVEAYNALGVVAAAIGNHEFDFGPAGPDAVPTKTGDDPRGALKARAREAAFPLLAANLADSATGRLVAWDNVQPSVLVDAAGVRVGIIGVLTRSGLRTTIAPNTAGLELTPLLDAVRREAAALREAGAALVVVVAHAGGRCRDVSDPKDTSSCDPSSELVRLALDLEPGEVDHIFGGHLDSLIAHEFDGVTVSVNLSKARHFGRIDFRVDTRGGDVVGHRLFPPQSNVTPRPAMYEGQALEPDPVVARIADAAQQFAADHKTYQLGVVVDAPFIRGGVESPVGNLVARALYDSYDVDVALINVRGGLRADLPAGELTFGHVYEMFPFDNVVTVHDLSGQALRAIFAAQARPSRRLGFAGLRVYAECRDGRPYARMVRDDGTEVGDDDRVTVLANDYLAYGGDRIMTPGIPAGGLEVRYDLPLTRDVIVDWLEEHGGHLHPDNWRSDDKPRWNLPDGFPQTCRPSLQ